LSSESATSTSVVAVAVRHPAILALAEDGEVVQAHEEAVFVFQAIESRLEHGRRNKCQRTQVSQARC
jgi:hypothetical protein